MQKPPKYKTAIMIWLAIYPSVTVLFYLLGDKIAGLPIFIRTLVLTLILVPLMVFILLPILQRLMKGWLMKE
jgi:antibiotic biosynthesis monooxygenase (ABM) superfamily enzyme